jgi:hypothetical protein
MGSPHHPHDSFSRALSASLSGPLDQENEIDYPPEADEAPDTGAPVADAPAAPSGATVPTGAAHPDHPNYLPYEYPAAAKEAPVIRLRVAKWDLICTVSLTALLLALAVATTWPHKLFGFLGKVCTGEDCGPVPFAVDLWINPLVWGGIGAAITAAGVGPFVSLLKGWFMSFWPVASLAALMVASVVGQLLTAFSERYW